MKMMTKSIVMLMLVAMFGWGCGDSSDGQGTVLDNGGVDQNCDEKPVCPEGLEKTDQCPQDDIHCEEVTLCGTTIQCFKEVAHECDEKLVCPDNTKQTSKEDYEKLAAAGIECKEVTACDETILCAEDKTSCEEKPLCPEGSYEVPRDKCETDADDVFKCE